MQAHGANANDARRVNRRVLILGAVVFALFAVVDVVAVVRPDVGGVVARNIVVLLIVGGATLAAMIAMYVAGRGRRQGEAAAPDTLSIVLDEIGGYTAFHGVNTRHGRMEHVLVGQGGIFVIASDAARGRGVAEERGVRIGGRLLAPEGYARLAQQARHIELRVQQVCGRRLPVHAVYVLTRATLSRDATHHGVRFTTLATLPTLLLHSRYFLDPRDVAIVKALLAGDPTALAQEARFGPDARSPLFPEGQSAGSSTSIVPGTGR